MLYFLEITQLLVEESNKYYQQYLDTLDKRCSTLSTVTTQEMYLFFQMEHDQRDKVKSYWSTL